MIQMDVPAAFVCSQVFAWYGRSWLEREPPSVTGRYTALATGYALGVIGACGLYLYSGWPEWEMMYWFAAVQMSTEHFGDPALALVGPLFLVALGLAAAGGFLLAHRWIRAGHPRRVLLALWAGVAVSLGMVLLTPSAPMFVGHYRDYHAYVAEALSSPRPWDYGILRLGPLTFGIPFAAEGELLARHGMTTFLGARFFVPWLIDIVLFLASAVALARWFARHQPTTARVDSPLGRDADELLASRSVAP